eukprot:6380805-Pyramimonas_sp.AAC.1
MRSRVRSAVVSPGVPWAFMFFVCSSTGKSARAHECHLMIWGLVVGSTARSIVRSIVGSNARSIARSM